MADIYFILPGVEPSKGGAQEVGNKAWNLMRMAQVGLRVPPAFVLPTTWSRRTQLADEGGLKQTLLDGIVRLEPATNLQFGATRRPLLVSVRSGAAVSMPGMMETVLDVGLNAVTVQALIRFTGNPRLAWDSYRRLVQGYSEVVAKLSPEPFEALLAAALERDDAVNDQELDFRGLRDLTMAMLGCYQKLTGKVFPADPHEQLSSAAVAVFRSWDAPKAVTYRRLNKITDDAGTAVTVQTMVFGNAGAASGSGVAFSRNPATGVREPYFDFEFDAQGEDVVAGRQLLRDKERLPLLLPAIWLRLNEVCRELETLFGDAQDFEFTIQSGVLFLLQTRRAKRTDWAAVTIAVDMVGEKVLTPTQGLALLNGIKLESVVRGTFALPVPATVAVAQVASIGVASGAIALDTEAVKRLAVAGSVIFVRREMATTDFEGMSAATGMLTALGGRTSHASVVARQLGKVCLVSCPGLTIDMARRQCKIGDTVLNEGDLLSLDGNTGSVHLGRLVQLIERPELALGIIAHWHSALISQ